MMCRVIISAIILLTTGRSNAQVDPHFSQYYAFPLWLNPAMAGVMDGDVRVSAIYRNQWNSVMVPYSTAGFSADIATSKNLDFGIDMIRQSAGDGGYRMISGSCTIAYSVKTGKDKAQTFTMGVRGGMLNRGFDPSNSSLVINGTLLQGLILQLFPVMFCPKPPVQSLISGQAFPISISD